MSRYGFTRRFPFLIILLLLRLGPRLQIPPILIPHALRHMIKAFVRVALLTHQCDNLAGTATALFIRLHRTNNPPDNIRVRKNVCFSMPSNRACPSDGVVVLINGIKDFISRSPVGYRRMQMRMHIKSWCL